MQESAAAHIYRPPCSTKHFQRCSATKHTEGNAKEQLQNYGLWCKNATWQLLYDGDCMFSPQFHLQLSASLIVCFIQRLQVWGNDRHWTTWWKGSRVSANIRSLLSKPNEPCIDKTMLRYGQGSLKRSNNCRMWRASFRWIQNLAKNRCFTSTCFALLEKTTTRTFQFSPSTRE